MNEGRNDIVVCIHAYVVLEWILRYLQDLDPFNAKSFVSK